MGDLRSTNCLSIGLQMHLPNPGMATIFGLQVPFERRFLKKLIQLI
jgi:hypothetical protein